MSSTTSAVSDTPSDTSQPTPQEQASAVPQVTQWLEDLDLNAMAPGSTTGSLTGGDGRKDGMKAGSPTEFTGGRNQVEAFILQCRMIFALDHDIWTSQHRRMIYIISYMKGPAFDFIQPHLRDYLEHPDVVKDRKESTRRILTRDETLFEEIRSTFGYGNEQQEAERTIQGIRQRESAAKYKAEFQILAAKINGNDEALAAQFYQGLKENVKDEIARDDRPDTFQEMCEAAIRIDTRIWERQLEKKGNFQPSGANRRMQREPPEWKNNYYGPQKMQLDATFGKPGPKGNRYGKSGTRNGQQKKPFDKTNLTCHNCGQKGHFARDCRSRKQRHELQGTTPKGTFAATKQDSHAGLSWTACYEDTCTIHQSDKDGSGWWPKAPRPQKVCVLRGQPAPERDDASGDDSATLAELNDEETSEEESSDEEQGSTLASEANEVLDSPWKATAKHSRCSPKSHDAMRRSSHAWGTNGTCTHISSRCCCRGSDLCSGTTDWSKYDFASIIQEQPPVGSKFAAGGYTVPDGLVISAEMRGVVTQLRQHYRLAQGIQEIAYNVDRRTGLHRQAYAEQQRHNQHILERLQPFRKEWVASRLMTKRDWERSQQGTQPGQPTTTGLRLGRVSPISDDSGNE